MASKKDPQPDACVSCGRAVGAEPKIAPVFVTDADSEGIAKREVWCPRCFAFKRAPMEPERFHPQSMGPVICSPCGYESLAQGRHNCSQCGSRFILDLPPVGAKVA